MHSSAPGAAEWMSARRCSRSARFSSLTVARYSSIVRGLSVIREGSCGDSLPAHPDPLDLPTIRQPDEVDVDMAQLGFVPAQLEPLGIPRKRPSRVERRE